MTALYYCMGGGLGHITRFAAFCHTTQTQPVLLTNCAAVINGQIKTPTSRCIFPDARDQADQASLRKWLQRVILIEKPCKLIIDAFPGGILGELCDLQELKDLECVYLARILNLKHYLTRSTGHFPIFSTIYRLEKLHDDHENLLNSMSAKICNLELVYPPESEQENAVSANVTRFLPNDYWAIIHSGNASEIWQLWQYACQSAELEGAAPEFVVVCQGEKPSFLPTSVTHFSIYPADKVMTRATRVFSAAGFNIIRQMHLARQKFSRKTHHQVLPFTRALDDQFFRAATHSNVT